ncbi:glycosyltransferase involved in cell wall biosynthesis [Mucilaginibacter gracilis]|uniref:Glycosyltransferase involved in cell wall biosynthesis n=1 Tax=Mucilaginibacter gracilis TaxID=423350 RepID=A0A495IZU8_9SPHI|nr:glycosyltransferase family 2 protein [Mucilaginibacter gracilis]RKR82246.1 glycosyltransferase involved in cell wall biosynthesis [Mucilaginibacter gracilis]
MILSVCIPTYNRLPELKINLKFLIQEVLSNYNDDVEIIISDNYSTDGTYEYINTLANQYPFIISHTNPSNIGMVPNWKKSISLARGKFVWLLGSDDIVIPGKFSLLKDAIYKYPEVCLFLLNNKNWNPEDEEFVNFDENIFIEAETHIKNSNDEYVPMISRLLGKREDQFTPIYLSVMKKADWLNALDLYDLDKPVFSTLANCAPQAVYIPEQMFNKEGYYINTPLVLASYNVGWKRYFSLYYCYYLVYLHGIWLKAGGDRLVVNESLKSLINNKLKRHHYRDLFVYNRDNLKYISFIEYLKLVYQYPKTYSNIAYIFLLNFIYLVKKYTKNLKYKG